MSGKPADLRLAPSLHLGVDFLPQQLRGGRGETNTMTNNKLQEKQREPIGTGDCFEPTEDVHTQKSTDLKIDSSSSQTEDKNVQCYKQSLISNFFSVSTFQKDELLQFYNVSFLPILTLKWLLGIHPSISCCILSPYIDKLGDPKEGDILIPTRALGTTKDSTKYHCYAD